MWRSRPDLPLRTGRELAEKIDDLGWRRLTATERKRVMQLGIAVCRHLPLAKARELAQVLGLTLPGDFVAASEEEIMRRGKNALMAKIRYAYRSTNAGAARKQCVTAEKRICSCSA